MDNTYFGLAMNDYKYLQATRHLKFYNNIAVQCQQICEKLLKAVIEQVVPNAANELRTHNLKRLYDRVKSRISIPYEHELYLGSFSDYYFDARYPGDDFVEVSEEDVCLCLEITDNLYKVVVEWFSNYKPNRPTTDNLVNIALKMSGN